MPKYDPFPMLRRLNRTEYRIWYRMHQRCSNPKSTSFKNYGGRGIRVCKRWSDFALFLKDMGKRPSASLSIDRRDNDGIYSPGNCRWATAAQQQANKQNTLRLTYQGERIAFVELCARVGIPREKLYRRLTRQRMTLEEALELG